MPLADSLKLIKESGFTSVCLWWGDEFAELNGKHIFAPEKCFRAGLIPENAHIPYYGCDSLWNDNLDGEAMLAKYCTDIHDAALSGLDTLVMHPFEMELPVKKTRLGFSRFARLGEEARRMNIKLAIENIRDDGPLRALLEYLNDEYCGLCFDSGHYNVAQADKAAANGEKPQVLGVPAPVNTDFSLISEWGDRLYAVHMHDNNGLTDQHILPGEGNICWEKLVAALQESAYAKSFMLESAYPYEYNEEMNYGAERTETLGAAAYLRKAFAACAAASSGVSGN